MTSQLDLRTQSIKPAHTEKTTHTTQTQEAEVVSETTDTESRLENAVKSSAARQEFCESQSQVLETRTLLKVSPQALPNHLTAHTLAGPGRISVPPHVFIDDKVGSLLAFYHLGTSLSGHTGLIHGGFLAVLLDECMGRACFGRLPEKIGVTVHLELDYKKPVKANTIVLVRNVTERVEGRKAWVKAIIETVEHNAGEVLVEASAIFIQPRWASEIDQIM